MRTRKKSRKMADPVTVVGGCDVPAHMLRELPSLEPLPKNPVDRQILRLLALHPELKAKFGAAYQESLNQSQKNGLLEQMQQTIGIRKFRKLKA
jgi:hypothetical protein